MVVKSIMSLSRGQKSLILLALDLWLVMVSYLAAMLLLHDSRLMPLVLLQDSLVQLPLPMLAGGVLSMCLGLSKIRLREYEGGAVARTAALAAILMGVAMVQAQLGQFALPPGLPVVFALICFVSVYFSRIVLTGVLTQIYLRSPKFTRVAIYGAGRTGMALAQELRKSADFVVCAFIDDNAALGGMTLNSLPVVSGAQLPKAVASHKIDRVILAMPSLSPDKQTFMTQRLEKLGVQVQSLPAFAQLHGGAELSDLLKPVGNASLLSRDPLTEELPEGFAAYFGRNVLISGAGGSIGLELCRQVIACRPAMLVLFELSELALYKAEAEMRVLAEPLGVEVVPVLGSITDAVHVKQVLETQAIDVVLHAAAYKHVPLVEMNARVGLSNNTLGTAVLARAARDAGVMRFVLVSSDKAVRPGNLMGASKRFAELVVQDLAARPSKTVFSIVRFGNVLGSSGSVVPLFREQIARGGPVTLTDERVTRYFMTIQEASKLVLLAGSLAEGGEVFMLDMGKPVRIGDLARKMIKASGYTVRDAANPDGDIEIVTTGLRPGEKLHEELMLCKGARATAHPKIIWVREHHLSELETAAALRDLRSAIDRGSEVDVIATVAWAVPEYAPQSLPEEALQCQVVEARRALARNIPAE
ncbi:FlaA1/EpsC-like NDP-sugar epimerase [Rhodobacter aestuarii]|uniref:NDP-sugar epimerase, includes UDP-GlcNAc-inverting 4,6-dehydratase FlaA1 and capsular polysaccharide biosynthesis protein EpsC n=2 Tax=Rhodobacter aestuarii TaxID=453582 RepID=A0A1N7Q4T0_9RHOB|nr:FlaA1/EpsC-like NDP-sugar epimerase [Rhodobacter aestuarii]SIT17900.1 NDP-sugar epimerase, includes UDP-GlcNAc-inverting 4,6-dehydratase FlaA1 and capsular polysaccharide biosynthesis protein EpsC [Rhodobacter aestuarii]